VQCHIKSDCCHTAGMDGIMIVEFVFVVVVIRSARVEFALFRFIVIEVVCARAAELISRFVWGTGARGTVVTRSTFPVVSQHHLLEEARFSNKSRVA
jgi:hypothetical protein